MKNIKKIILSAMLAVMLVLPTSAYASDSISVVLNGQKVSFPNAQPVIYDDRTLIPVRAVFEDMGCYVDWDNANKQAVIGNDDKIIFIPIDNIFMQVYDIATDTQTDIALDVPAMIISDSTMIPLRAVGEALGAEVEWESKTSTVYINKQ